MLTTRIIPCLDIDGGRVVKGVSFGNIRDAGDPAELASFYDSEGADELVFLDITASSDAREIMIDVVKAVSEKVFIPLTVGGGIRSIPNIHKMLESGADKVSLNTSAILTMKLISEAADHFGCQCIVVAMDVKKLTDNVPTAHHFKDIDSELSLHRDSRWEVYTHGGRNRTGIDAIKWAIRACDLGAGELLVTSMDEDGHRNGYDIDLMRAVSEKVPAPIIASGGAGTLEHLVEAARDGQADAVLAASIFHYGEYTIGQAKNYFLEQGLSVRLD